MPEKRLSRFILLPHLELEKWSSHNRYTNWVRLKSTQKGGFCPRCGVFSDSGYDTRSVRVKDEPLRASSVYLLIRKKRFWCPECRKPFTEKVPGILPGRRTTERFRRSVLQACENYQDLKKVRKQYRISDGFVYKILYEQLDLKLRKNRHPWPKVIGIDEHSFQKRRRGQIPFVSYFIDYDHKKPFELVPSKQIEALKNHLAHIPGRENVQWAITDLADPYKRFVREFFPQAKLVADKFHVLRLLSPSLIRERSQIHGSRQSLRYRRLLLTSAHRLDWFQKHELKEFLDEHPKLKELWLWKEKLHNFYRIRGVDRARWALHKLLKDMKNSSLKEIKTLRKTLWKWSEPILNYFITRLTNARTEGHNNKAKLVKRRAYGFRSFENYRLRLLCDGL